MLPIVAIVGRPNVGKSTLFNALTRTRDAIVADVPGVTRDRQYGYARIGSVPCVLIDTGGLVENPRRASKRQMRIQTERAVQEADRLVLLVDARAGLTAQDLFVAAKLRRAGKPVTARDQQGRGTGRGRRRRPSSSSWAWASRIAISAAHGQGCRELMDAVLPGIEREPVAPPRTRARSASRSSAGPMSASRRS